MKDMPCTWIGRLNIVNISILLKPIYRFNAISIKISMAYFTEIIKKWNHKRSQIVKENVEKVK